MLFDIEARRLAVSSPKQGSSIDVPIMSDDPQKRARERADEFHMAMGYCIAEWANIEEQLFRLCELCIGKPAQAAIIYYRTPGLRPRLDLAAELIRSIIPRFNNEDNNKNHPDYKIWSDILSDIINNISIRNRIAHYPVETKYPNFFDLDPFNLITGGLGGTRHFIVGHKKENLRERFSAKPPLSLSDLHNHLETTKNIVSKLQQFYDALLKHAQSPA
jgi:hypothetical protein